MVNKLPCWLGLLTIGITFLNSPASSAQAARSRVINSVPNITRDMRLLHEGKPLGVSEAKDWALGPRLAMGNDPGDFKAMTAWGHVYEGDGGNPATNTRIQIRGLKSYLLNKKTQKWELLQDSYLVEGAAFRNDYAHNSSKPADTRLHKDGSVSVTLSRGYNFHFWTTTGRVLIRPSEIGGIFTTVQARLIVHDRSKPDDRDQARYLLGMGGDYWLNRKAQWNYFKTNADIGIGRFKYVRRYWKAFNMTTVPRKVLLSNPPPLE